MAQAITSTRGGTSQPRGICTILTALAIIQDVYRQAHYSRLYSMQVSVLDHGMSFKSV